MPMRRTVIEPMAGQGLDILEGAEGIDQPA